MSNSELTGVRLTFSKTPSLEELLFIRMPKYDEERVIPQKGNERRYFLNEVGALAEKLRRIWPDKDSLPLPQRCVVSKIQSLRLMEKLYGVSDEFKGKPYIITSIQYSDEPWLQIIREQTIPPSKSIFQHVNDTSVSRISTAPQEEYGLISVRLKTRGEEPTTNTNWVNLAAIIKQEECRNLIRLLGREPVWSAYEAAGVM
jgi:hypothetical protein